MIKRIVAMLVVATLLVSGMITLAEGVELDLTTMALEDLIELNAEVAKELSTRMAASHPEAPVHEDTDAARIDDDGTASDKTWSDEDVSSSFEALHGEIDRADAVYENSDLQPALPLPKAQAGFIRPSNGLNKVAEVASASDSRYWHYSFTDLEPGTYYIDGTQYKAVRVYLIADTATGKIVRFYPDKELDYDSPVTTRYQGLEVNIEEGQTLYLNGFITGGVAPGQHEPNVRYKTGSFVPTASPSAKADEVASGFDSSSETQALSGNILAGKKWAICGDSFTYGDFTNALTDDYTITDGLYAGKNRVYGYIIGNRNNMIIQDLSAVGRTLAKPLDHNFTNTLIDHYQEIAEDVDYITIYLGINDSHHAFASSGVDGEDTSGTLSIGTIDSTAINTFYGAWNTILPWLKANRPHAHIGIIVSNGVDSEAYRTATIAIARKYGIPFIDLNGDDRTPCMIRSCNSSIDLDVRDNITQQQAVNFNANNRHPSADTHEYESTFIENFLRSL